MYTYTLASSDIVYRSDGAWIPADVNNIEYLAYLLWIEEGNVPLPYIQPPEPPLMATPLQFRRGLSRYGLRDAVEAWIPTAGLDIQDAYKYASAFVENDPLITSAAEHFNLSAEQVHELFLSMQTLPI